MIASPQKEYNAYRILRVISSLDFLATDFCQRFYILSAVQKRDMAPLASPLPIHKQKRQIEMRIIQAIECIEIDHMHYYVFSIGINDVRCATSIDSISLMKRGYLLGFFASSIRGILKYLLMRPLQDCKKILDIRNFIIIKGQLHLLELDRGRRHFRSLQKSEKLLLAYQKDSLQKQLGNELQIIKCFGTVLWEVLFKAPFSSVARPLQHPVVDILKGMISKQYTFDYLDMRVKELLGKTPHSFERKAKKMHFNFKECDSRYQTESLSSEKQPTVRRVSTEGIAIESSSSRYQPLIQRRKKMVSEIRTGNQPSQTNHRRLVSSINSNYSNPYKAIAIKSPFQETFGRVKVKGLEPLFPAKLRQKLLKQNESAQTKFSKIVELSLAIKSNREEEVSQTLRDRLISRIKRIKTETKNYETQRESYSYHSHNKFQLESSEGEAICKRLEFTQAGDHAEHGLLRSTNIQHLDESTLEGKAGKKSSRQEEKIANLPLHNQTAVRDSESNKSSQEEIEFEVIQLPQEALDAQEQSQVPPSCLSNPILVTADPASNLGTAKQIKQITMQNKDSVAERQKTSFTKKKINMTSHEVSTDEIQVIKFQKKEFQLPTLVKESVRQSAKSNSNRLPGQEKSAYSIQSAVSQFQELVNVLGRVAKKSIGKSSDLQVVEWYRGTYFIFERYVYEREKFSEALALGAKQIARSHHPLDQNQWNLWLSSDHRKEMLARVEIQNKEIKKDFDSYVTRILKQFKFQRKVEYYIRNREKYYGSFAGKVRVLLSQFAAKYTIEAYDLILQKKMGKKELQIFVWDGLFAMLVIAELDGLLEQSHRVHLYNFEKYSNDLDRMEEIVECLYSLYFEERNK